MSKMEKQNIKILKLFLDMSQIFYQKYISNLYLVNLNCTKNLVNTSLYFLCKKFFFLIFYNFFRENNKNKMLENREFSPVNRVKLHSFSQKIYAIDSQTISQMYFFVPHFLNLKCIKSYLLKH